MTDTDAAIDLRDVLTELRRHLEWHRDEVGDAGILMDREVIAAYRVATRSETAAEGSPASAPTTHARPSSAARPLASPPPVRAPEAIRPAAVSQPAATAVARGPAAPAPAPPPTKLPRSIFDLPPVTPVSEAERRTLDEVRRELGDCRRCKLCSGRKNIVFGVGNPRAELVFVGEGPGADEDTQGVPFVGKAGQLLTKMIEAMGFLRDDVYICNVVKCRPPNNRNPEIDEIFACEPFLRAQLGAIQPKAIVALGKFAAQTLLRDETPISRLRGTWRTYCGIPLMPTYHPAYLLRNPAEKRAAWSDLQQVMAKFGKTPPKREG